MASFLFRGLLIGLIFGIPAGAVGAMTIQRTLEKGVKAGLFTGLGSSVADCLYAAAGVCGFTVLSDFLLAHQRIINLAGGLLVLYMGLSLMRHGKQKQNHAGENVKCYQMFLTSFAVGITNPTAIFAFLIAFSWFDVQSISSTSGCCLLIAGIFLGTYVWWMLLSFGTGYFKTRFVKNGLEKVYRVLGWMLVILGIAMFFR